MSVQAREFQADQGLPRVDRFLSDHGKVVSCRDIAVDPAGKVYVANDGVMVFDGETWQEIKDVDNISALAVDSLGNIWCGGNGRLNKLHRQTDGSYSPQHLNDLDTNFSDKLGYVWRVYLHNDGAFFVTNDKVIFSDSKQIKTWSFESQLRVLSFMVDGALHLYIRGKGLQRFDGIDFRQILDEQPEFDSGICAILPTRSGYLLSTLSQGFFEWDGASEALNPCFDHLNDRFTDELFFQGAQTLDGNFAFASLNGLIVIDSQGRIVTEAMDGSVGVLFDFVEAANGSLWLARGSGPERVSYAVSSAFDDLPNPVVSITRQGKDLILASGGQIFKLEPSRASLAEFHELAALDGVFCDGVFALDDETLIVSRLRSIQVVVDSSVVAELPSYGNYFRPFPSNEPEVFYGGGISQLGAYRFADGKLEKIGEITGLNSPVTSCVELQDGSLMLSTLGGVIHHAETLIDNFPKRTTRLGDAVGLPDTTGWAAMGVLGSSQIIAVTDKGIYQLDQKKRTFHRLGFLFDSENTHETIGSRLVETEDGRLIAYLRTSQKSGFSLSRFYELKWRAGELLVNQLFLPEVNDLKGENIRIHHEYSGRHEILWIGTSAGVFRYILSDLAEPSLPKVQFSLIGRNGEKLEPLNPTEIIDLDYPLRDFTFQYSALRAGVIEYETFLEGQDSSWVAGGAANSRAFSNLREGHYTFRVRAIDEFGRAGPETAYAFTVLPPLPPWYRQWWAYLAYAALAIAAISGLVTVFSNWQSRALAKKLREREAELAQQSEEKAKAYQFMQENAEILTVASNVSASLKANDLNSFLESLGQLNELKKRAPIKALVDFDNDPLDRCRTKVRELINESGGEDERLRAMQADLTEAYFIQSKMLEQLGKQKLGDSD